MVAEDAKSSGNVAMDIARHYYARILIGKAVIITDDPKVLLKALQRQWARLTRRLQAKRAETPSNRVVIVMDLTFTITKMQCQRFTAESPRDHPCAHVFIMHPTDLGSDLPKFATLYITCAVDSQALEAAMVSMPPNGTVMRYS